MPRLFSIETPAVRLTWSLRRDEPPPVPQAAAEPPFGLVAEPLQAGVEPALSVNEAAPTHLFEETSYTLLLQSQSGADVRLRHRDPALLRGLTRDGGIVHGTLSFGSQVGRSRFVVEVGGAPHLAFEVEVFPSKLDYREDYERLRADVQALADELAFAYLRATYTPARPLPAQTSGTLAWLTLLRHALEDLEGAVERIAERPQRGVAWERRAVRAERVRRPDAALRRAVLRSGGLAGNGDAARHLPSPSAHYTLDTPEHRWLAYELDQLGASISAAREAEARGRPSLRLQATLRELEALERRVERVRRRVPGETPPAPAPALAAADAGAGLPRGVPGVPPAPARRPRGGRAAGAGAEGPPRAVRALVLPHPRPPRRRGGWASAAGPRASQARAARPPPPPGQWARPNRDDRPRRRRTSGAHQQPPLRRPEPPRPSAAGRPPLPAPQPGGPALHAVLDAKYRLDASAGYRRRYGLPGPPTDALGDLHRYRDAIRIGGERAVTHAVALFPYREERPGAWAASRHRRALLDLGVGAIPLLPGETEPLRAWLRSLFR